MTRRGTFARTKKRGRFEGGGFFFALTPGLFCGRFDSELRFKTTDFYALPLVTVIDSGT